MLYPSTRTHNSCPYSVSRKAEKNKIEKYHLFIFNLFKPIIKKKIFMETERLSADEWRDI